MPTCPFFIHINMACENLSRNRSLECRDSVGGLKNVYFINYGDYAYSEVDFDNTDTDVITQLDDTGVEAYKYELKGTSSFTQNVTSSRENGTTFFEQVLELTLQGLTSADHVDIDNIAKGRPVVLVEDYNENVFVVGLEHGTDVTGGTVVTGATMGDLSGYTLTLTGMERMPANFLNFVTDVATTLSTANVDVYTP